MCNVNSIKWGIKNLTEQDVQGKRILEVGSYDVNGSLRYGTELLKPAEYIGVDIEKGPGVDIICSSDDMVQKFGENSFDVVLSTCLLEHVRHWKNAVTNMKKVCKPNGIILMIVPSQWPFHEFPYDFWRYTKEDIKNIFSDCEILTLEEDHHKPSLVYAKIKKPSEFTENDLTDYQLHSVVTNKKTNEIQDRDLQSFYFRYLVFKNKTIHKLLELGRNIFS